MRGIIKILQVTAAYVGNMFYDFRSSLTVLPNKDSASVIY